MCNWLRCLVDGSRWVCVSLNVRKRKRDREEDRSEETTTIYITHPVNVIDKKQLKLWNVLHANHASGSLLKAIATNMSPTKEYETKSMIKTSKRKKGWERKMIGSFGFSLFLTKFIDPNSLEKTAHLSFSLVHLFPITCDYIFIDNFDMSIIWCQIWIAWDQIIIFMK